MQALQTFNFEELPVRTLEVDGEPYFIVQCVNTKTKISLKNFKFS